MKMYNSTNSKAINTPFFVSSVVSKDTPRESIEKGRKLYSTNLNMKSLSDAMECPEIKDLMSKCSTPEDFEVVTKFMILYNRIEKYLENKYQRKVSKYMVLWMTNVVFKDPALRRSLLESWLHHGHNRCHKDGQHGYLESRKGSSLNDRDRLLICS